MKIALISLDQLWQDKEKNYKRCEEFCRQASTLGCDLIVFPEMTLTGYSLEVGKLTEKLSDSETLKKFGELSNDIGISIVFGACLSCIDNAIPYNSLCTAAEDTPASHVYSKIHPFSYVGEDKYIHAGNNIECAFIGELKFIPGICYDLRFPEIFSILAPECNASVVIANWPASRVDHWRALLVARAIENQLFMIGVNRVGVDGAGLTYEKSSMIVGPDGGVLKPEFSDNEIDVYQLDIHEVDHYRGKFPTVTDKRYGLYRELLERSNVEE